MSEYRDASFRGAAFKVPGEIAGRVGRRLARHEYPLRERPYNEDLGRQARTYQIEGLVIGPDYAAQRDALLAACEEPGPGELVHPIFGVQQVICINCNHRESRRQQGAAFFQLEFEEAGERNFPAQAVDFTAQAAAAAQDLQATAGEVFAQVYRQVGPAWLRAVMQGDVAAALTLVKAVAGAMPSPFDSGAVTDFLDLVDQVLPQAEAAIAGDDPAALAALLETALSGLGDLVGESPGIPQVAGVLEAAKYGEAPGSTSASILGGTLPAVSAGTTSRQAQADNRAALVALVRQLALTQGVTAALRAEYASQQDAAATRDAILGHLDGLLHSSDDPRQYRALSLLYAETASAFQQLGASLAHLVERPAPVSPTPAVVLAYDLYEDLGREAEIVARNQVANPAILPGGALLKVLDA